MNMVDDRLLTATELLLLMSAFQNFASKGAQNGFTMHRLVLKPDMSGTVRWYDGVFRGELSFEDLNEGYLILIDEIERIEGISDRALAN
jgi:hypothetical protein